MARSGIWELRAANGKQFIRGSWQEVPMPLDVLFYKGRRVGHLLHAEGTFLHVTHPVAGITEAEYGELRRALGDLPLKIERRTVELS